MSPSDPTQSAAAEPAAGHRVGPTDLGRRIVVRRLTGGVGPSGNPEMTDVVGVLVEILGSPDGGPQTWRIRRRDESESVVDSSQVVAVKRLAQPPSRLGRASDISTHDLEQIAAAGWQPLESIRQQDWVLRAAGGFTGRANSVLPLSDPGFASDTAALDQALAEVRQWYHQRGLRAMFALPLPWQSSLDEALDGRGWQAKNRTQVMVAEVPEVLLAIRDDRTPPPTVLLSDHPTPAWLDTYSYRGEALPDFAATVMMNADHPVFARIADPVEPTGPLLAVGRAALTPAWVGITAVDVRQAARRRGLATHVVRGLLEYAYARGHRHAYLQVAAENTGARALYDKLGFSDHHHYQYRTAP